FLRLLAVEHDAVFRDPVEGAVDVAWGEGVHLGAGGDPAERGHDSTHQRRLGNERDAALLVEPEPVGVLDRHDPPLSGARAVLRTPAPPAGLRPVTCDLGRSVLWLHSP